MGGLGYALAGALAGAGEGMTMRAKNDMEMERQRQLESIRSYYNQEDARVTADLNDRNAERNEQRKAKADAENDRRTHEFRVDEILTTAQQARITDDHRTQNDMSLERVKTAFKLSSDKEIETFKNNLDANNIKTIQQDADGNWFGVREDGSTYSLGRTGQLKGSGGDGGDIPLTRTPPAATPAPAQRPAPAAQPKPKPQASAQPKLKRISQDEYARLTTEIGNSKDPRLAGLNADQRKQKLVALLAAKGLSPP